MTEWLDPLQLPLRGSRLIEASAGTGKTWTIAALYVRLILGMGDTIAGAAEGLMPSQILVVTFTRAATRELLERIRARLKEAAQVLAAPPDAATQDAFLLGLQGCYATPAQRDWALWRLESAAQALDQAAIVTIDAWCQRMLREHPFEAESLREWEVLADEGPYRIRAMQDVWRQEIYPLEGEALQAVLQTWSDYAAFERAVARYPGQPGGLQEEPLGQQFLQERERMRQWLAPHKSTCARTLLPLQDWLLAQLSASSNPFSATKLKEDKVREWFAILQHWCREETLQSLDFPEKVWWRLSTPGLRDALKKNAVLDIPTAFDGFPALQSALDQIAQQPCSLLPQAVAKVQWRARQLKEIDGVMGFGDLLEHFHARLESAAGEALCERIRKQFPVVMIDEFQDTSALQFKVFDRLYALEKNHQDSAVLLIGDPKQSIYAFRGADLASYIRAKACTEGRHYALARNYRSARALVNACNHLFEQSEQRSERGAFLYRQGTENPLPFVAVKAQGLSRVLKVGEREAPALHLVLGRTLRSATEDREHFAALAAEHLVQQLNLPDCGFQDPVQGFEALRPAHVAFLVRDRHEAEVMRQALRQRRIFSVYLSEREGVFSSVEALHLLYWLRAVSQPRDGRLLRAAFATSTMDSGLGEMLRRATDDRALESDSALLHQLWVLWQRQGVLPMLRQTLFRLNLPARWLSRPGGERRLTNVLHLAELLQQASVSLSGEAALVRWFEDQVLGSGEQRDEQQLRLESDSDLVTIMTIHKAKGLQFPLVYLPFMAHFRQAEGESVASPQAQPHLQRLQEEMRLLYVALTRAQHALWLGVGTFRVGKQPGCALSRSALGVLLTGGQETPWEHLLSSVERVLAQQPGVICAGETADTAGPTALVARESAPSLHPATPYDGHFSRDWRISSFSALVRDSHGFPVLSQTPHQSWEDEEESGLHQEALRVGAEHVFPAGPMAGKFLHEQLAWLAEQGFHRIAEPQIREYLLLRCHRSLWAEHANGLLEWLQQVVQTPLPDGGSLRQLRSYRAEMEFWFPLRALPTASIDQLCASRYLPGMTCTPLGAQSLQGFMMGFTDLVFEWKNRWWILDYKSNVLGAGDEDYTEAAMRRSVAVHRYDVQAMIYLLALHRLLKLRMGQDYHPERHLGGAIVFYLRGVRGPEAGCLVWQADQGLVAQLDHLMGQAGERWDE